MGIGFRLFLLLHFASLFGSLGHLWVASWSTLWRSGAHVFRKLFVGIVSVRFQGPGGDPGGS